MARGDNISKMKPRRRPPEQGSLSDEQMNDAVLMERPNKGRRYIASQDVDGAKGRGWQLVNINPRPEPMGEPDEKTGPKRIK